MSEENRVIEYPKDSQKYQYVYISLRSTRGCILSIVPFSAQVYQVIDEDEDFSIYTSEKFREGYMYPKANREYRKILNKMVQEGWEEDGSVYCHRMNESLPRYRYPRQQR